MSKYQYDALSSGSSKIRLLRLLPNSNPSSDVQCELFEYSLQTIGSSVVNEAPTRNPLASSLRSLTQTHLYEALSYVWGNAAETRTIFINNHAIRVTVNLHAALSRLRNHVLDRVLWVDALCINQEDDVEKADQIQIMASIYAQANRVVVWLGEEADGSDEALDYLRAVAETDLTGTSAFDVGDSEREAVDARSADEDENSSTTSRLEPSYIKQQLVIKLLQRPWFSRIWVLQEVGAARQVSVLCGLAEIDGYVFCTGLTKISSRLAEFETSMGAMTYWMRRAIFRTKNRALIAGEATLGELIDMYHTYKATVQHDKIYALLGMSSDNPSPARLRPSYAISWAAVFQELISVLISPDTKVCAFDGKQIAVFRSKGYIIGEVLYVEVDEARPDKQKIEIMYTTPMSWEYEQKWTTEWTVQASARSVRRGDAICVLAGSPRPTIIRMYTDYSEVIMISPKNAHKREILRAREEEYYSANFLRDFLLTWSWNKEREGVEADHTFDAFLLTNDSVLEDAGIALSKFRRAHDMGLLARDVADFETTGNRLQETLTEYKTNLIASPPNVSAGDEGHAQISATEESLAIISALEKGLAILHTEKRRWEQAEALVWEANVPDNESQADSYTQTLIEEIAPEQVFSWINRDEWPKRAITRLHGQPYLDTDDSAYSDSELGDCIFPKSRYRARMVSRYIVLGRVSPVLAQEVIQGRRDPERHNIYISETVLLRAAGRPGPGMLDIFLDMPKELVPLTQAVAERAASNEAFGVETMTRLLDEWPSEIKLTTQLQEASASNPEHGFALVKCLFERRQDTVPLTTTFLKNALGAYRTWGLDMIRLLFETRLEELKALWTLDVMRAIVNNGWVADPTMGLVGGKRPDKNTEDLRQTVKMLLSRLPRRGLRKVLKIYEKHWEDLRVAYLKRKKKLDLKPTPAS